MSSRSFADVAPTSATLALNAAFTGYGGHSLLTPHYAIKQLWWTEERIRARVTLNFITNRLTGEERDFLNRPVSFGDGLTDQTYLEWILEKARRLFLILAEIGLPDQIFGCIDDSWDDNDLPIPLDVIPSLELSIELDPVINKKFYDTQFIYLLRELQSHTHIDYGPKEHIPMEHVNTRPPAVALQMWDRVHFPDRPADVYMRRKYTLAQPETDGLTKEGFMKDVKKAQKLTHEHIAPVWASYTSNNAAYVLSTFVGEHTLATFIEHRLPASYQRVPAPERPALLLKWMHCLADTLASLHHRGVAHTAIRPSNVLVSSENRIAFADIGSLRTFQRGKKISVTETYNYAAPESKLASPSVFEIHVQVSKRGAFNKLRKSSSSTAGSSSSSSVEGSTRNSSVCTATTIPPASASMDRTNSVASGDVGSPLSYSSPSFYSMQGNPTRLSTAASDVPQSPRSPLSPLTITPLFSNVAFADAGTLCDLPVTSPQMSDIFSLGCLYLDLLTFMLKGRIDGFVKYRTTRVRSSLSNNKTVRVDTSFHYDPDKINSWMAMLEEESKDSKQRSAQVYRGIPELLQCIRRMLQQNATLRPTALEVRNEVQRILVDLCGLDTLCCVNRKWSVASEPEEMDSPYLNTLRDSVSTAPGISEEQASRIAAEGESSDSISPPSEVTASPYLNNIRDSMSTMDSIMVQRTFDVAVESITRCEATATSTGGGRQNSTKRAPGTKVAPWRRAFLRSS